MGPPLRTCTGCRTRRPKQELVRVVRGPDGVARLAAPGLPGRGGYTCRDERCIRRAFESGRLRRVLKVEEEGLPGRLLGEMLRESKIPEMKGRAWPSRGFTR